MADDDDDDDAFDCTPSQEGGSSSQSPKSSPLPKLPWGRLLPCSQVNQAFDLEEKRPQEEVMMMQQEDDEQRWNEHWLGRSTKECDIVAPNVKRPKPTSSSTATTPTNKNSSNKSKNDSETRAAVTYWARSMISNKHCRIYCTKQRNNDDSSMEVYIEDASGNGTLINQTVLLRKGQARLLHAGDEICLVNPETLKKKIKSNRQIQSILQQFSYVFVLTRNNHNHHNRHDKKKAPCVNPRAMHYNPLLPSPKHGGGPAAASSSGFRRIEADYDIRQVIGDGTSGQVRKAIHRATGTLRAVKVLSLRHNRGLNLQWQQEASILKSLDHPYIVKLVDAYMQPGVAMYLVMELVAGGDLFDRIVQMQSYTEVQARRTMRRLLSAVHYLHVERNIVHRDLKPENILLASRDNPYQVKLTDFGLAKACAHDAALKTFCGTPQYFAPEVWDRRNTVTGQGRYGKPADMWSLGVILYILLAGRPPWEPEQDDCSALDFSDPLWASVSPLVKELIQGLLQPNPKQRWTVAQACDHAWILMDDGDTHVHPLKDPAVLSTTSTRRKLFSTTSHEDDRSGAEDSSSSTTSSKSTVQKENSDGEGVAAVNKSSLSRSGSLFANAVGGSGINSTKVNSSTSSTMSMSIVDEGSSSSGDETAKVKTNGRNDKTSNHKESSNAKSLSNQNDGTSNAAAAMKEDVAISFSSITKEEESSVTSPTEEVSRPKESSVTPGSPIAKEEKEEESPRSPLSPRSLNKDDGVVPPMILPPPSQNHRKQVVFDDPKVDDHTIERKDTESPSDQPIKKRGVAVTPSSSSIRGAKKAKLSSIHQTSEPLELPEDEICSQFSQDDEIESYTDDDNDDDADNSSKSTASKNGNDKSASGKRPRDEEATGTTAASSSKDKPFEGSKKQKQLTLSNFFPKKPKN